MLLQFLGVFHALAVSFPSSTPHFGGVAMPNQRKKALFNCGARIKEHETFLAI
jgi:hypothetical protein